MGTHPTTVVLALLPFVLAGCANAGPDAADPDQADPASPPADGGTGAPESNGTLTLARAPPTSWELVDCEAFVGGFGVPISAIRDQVPAGYHILGEEAGQAGLAVAVNRCKKMGVDGEPGVPAMISEVAVVIASPDGTGGLHQYMLWMSTDHPGMQAAMAALDIPSELGPEALDLGTGLPGSTASGSASNNGTYGLSATSISPGLPVLFPGTYWHDGPAGTAILACMFDISSLAAGQATVTAQEGSPLAQLMGGTTAQGGALLVASYSGAASITYG